MLKTKRLHPERLRVLASSGHFSQILIADGRDPVASRSGAQATQVFLNPMPGIPKTTEVLEALLAMTPFQDAVVMQAPNGETRRFANLLLTAGGVKLDQSERY